MNTWSCKKPLVALAALSLTACEGGQGNTPIIAQAPMASGAVTLVAPSGYCIDTRSLTEKFALMARCDVLSPQAPPQNVPLAVITASIAPAAPDAPLPTAAQAETADSIARTYDPESAPGRVTFHADGQSPSPDLLPEHWRAAARIGEYFASLALYMPKGSKAAGPQGRAILNSVIDAAQSQPAND